MERTDSMLSVWLIIPKLTEICWEAVNHYYPNLQNYTPNELLQIGIPLKYVKRFEYESLKCIDRQNDLINF